MKKRKGVLTNVTKRDIKLLYKNPDKFWKGVTKIGDSAFRSCHSLNSIEIPDGVTQVGESAFRSCITLKSIEIPDSVTQIGNGAFACCSSLKSIKIPKGVTEIACSAFYYCELLASVIIPDSVTKIGNAAFCGCKSLEGVIIPDSVTEIGRNAFDYCFSLKSVKIPKGVTEIAFRTFFGCRSIESVLLPDSITKIGSGAFENCIKLKSVIIPNSVTKIGESVFERCSSLESIVIPDSITEIGYAAFSDCKNLKTVYLSKFAPDDIENYFKDKSNFTDGKMPDIIDTEEYYKFAESTSFKDVVKTKLNDNKEDELEKYNASVKAEQSKIATDSAKILQKQIEKTANLFSYEILSKNNVESFSVQCMEACASQLYSGGELRTMAINPDMQPLVVRDINNNPVALGVIYVNSKQGYAVVNHFEVDEKYQGKDAERKQIYERAMQCVEDFVLQYNAENPHRQIEKVTSGCSPNWTSINDFIEQNPQSELLDAPSFDDFSYEPEQFEGDCHKKQHTIWGKEKAAAKTA